MDLSVNQTQSEPESAPEAIQSEGEKHENVSKKLWKCKKKIYSNILNQMEFYFSPANLAKDRFMKSLIDKDPCKCSQHHKKQDI